MYSNRWRFTCDSLLGKQVTMPNLTRPPACRLQGVTHSNSRKWNSVHSVGSASFAVPQKLQVDEPPTPFPRENMSDSASFRSVDVSNGATLKRRVL